MHRGLPQWDEVDNGRRYLPHAEQPALSIATRSIRIIPEERADESEEFARAREAIRGARRLVFMGLASIKQTANVFKFDTYAVRTKCFRCLRQLSACSKAKSLVRLVRLESSIAVATKTASRPSGSSALCVVGTPRGSRSSPGKPSHLPTPIKPVGRPSYRYWDANFLASTTLPSD